MRSTKPRTGIVLSGGGARGAYEAGLVAGIIEVLQPTPAKPPFQIFAGTSVGAINASFLAANAQRQNLAADELCDIWRGLNLRAHLQLDLTVFLGFHAGLTKLARRVPFLRGRLDDYLRPSLLDPRPLEGVVRDHIPWGALRANLRSGIVDSLVVAALEVRTGRTTMFVDLAPGADFRPSKDPRRQVRRTTIEAHHILASAAIPVAFPARRIGDEYYSDGGLRFNTPISPAIRSGADRLVVVSLIQEPIARMKLLDGGESEIDQELYANPLFLAGKILNALLLDPIGYDLQVLERFNKLLKVLDDTLDPAERKRLEAVMRDSRGVPYRILETLSFAPSEDIGRLAFEHLRQHLPRLQVEGLVAWMLGQASSGSATWEADLASYFLFDGAFAGRLIELGRHDAHAREAEIRAFFA
ncbi:MAG: patatin-like phospholipase family protein [Myxococcales bacterium]|nr:patatin-like phospholipase family protein [Myxococcales bacterium]